MVVSVDGSANVSATVRWATSGPSPGIREGTHLVSQEAVDVNCCCQRQAQVFDVPLRRMISLVPTPSALRSTMSARQACFCEALLATLPV